MNNAMPCITDSDEHRFSPVSPRAQAVEDYADNLLAECVTLAGAVAVNNEFDLFDGMLLPQMMHAVACWQGSGASAISQMRALHNLLADALQSIAEKEVK